jgi:Tol biopolymer transport system component
MEIQIHSQLTRQLPPRQRMPGNGTPALLVGLRPGPHIDTDLQQCVSVPPRSGPTTMFRVRRAWRVLLGTVLAGLSGCGQGEDLAGPVPPALRVTTATAGNGTDPDGYALVIDGRAAVPMEPLDTVLESGITPGAHTVDLQGVSGGCSVQGGPSRSVNATEGTITQVDFGVTCSVPEPVSTGTVRVTLTTSGVDVDPDGYLVAVDPSESRSVGVSDGISIEGVPAGPRDVGLSGLAANCSVQGENPRGIEVPADGEVEVAFAVRCWPPASGRIAFAHASAFLGSSQLVVIGADGNEQAIFFTPDAAPPSWSPESQSIAFVDGTVFVGEVSTGTTVPLPECHASAPRPSWSPDRQRLLCLTNPPSASVFSIRRDGTDPIPLSPGGLTVVAAHYLANGDVLFVEEITRTVYRVRAQGGSPVRLFDLPAGGTLDAEAVVPSPDGSRTTYTRDRTSGRVELYAANLNGSDPHLLSADLHATSSSAPVWSPDGAQLAFAVGSEDGDQLWLVHRDGLGLMQVPLPGPLEFSQAMSWSPDGTRLAVAVLQDGSTGDLESSIFIVRADGSGLERLTARGYDQGPEWGP